MFTRLIRTFTLVVVPVAFIALATAPRLIGRRKKCLLVSFVPRLSSVFRLRCSSSRPHPGFASDRTIARSCDVRRRLSASSVARTMRSKERRDVSYYPAVRIGSGRRCGRPRHEARGRPLGAAHIRAHRSHAQPRVLAGCCVGAARDHARARGRCPCRRVVVRASADAARHALPAWIPAFVIGGAAANLIDRAAFGAVHDFFVIPPVVLNVADVAVFAGLIGYACVMHRPTSAASPTRTSIP